jgi:hypothetical protein
MGFLTKNLFSYILIFSVIFIIFLSSPVYKVLSGKGNNGVPLIEGMTSSDASKLGLTGDGTANNPYIIPQKLIVRSGDGQWKDKIKNEDKSETGLSPWGIDNQFMGTGGNMIGDQYRYFAEWWMAKYNPKADANIFLAANVKGNNYSNTGSSSDYGLYKFVITGKNNDGSINYSGVYNNSGWNWTSPALSPAPTPLVASTDTLASYGCTKCSDDTFTCTKLPQSNILKNGNTIPANTPSLISNYRDGGYDSTTPSYIIEGKNYWWRQGGGCVESKPTPTQAPDTDATESKIPNPSNTDKNKFESKKCNSGSTRDGNCYPACIPVSGGKVIGPPYEIYGGVDNARGPDGLPFDMMTSNYFYERPVGRSSFGGKYYPITDASVSSVKYGSDTDCRQKQKPEPPKPTPSGPCDTSCRKVKDPRFAKEACEFNKETGYTCSACPSLPNGEIDCNNFRAKCSGCGADLVAKFPVGWQPDSKRRPSDKPYTGTECNINCEKPGVQVFQNYLDTFRDNTGFDSGSCEIIGRNTIKCRPVRKGFGAGVDANGGMKPTPTPDECVLCNEENLQGYATFERKWDDYTKQNNYVNIKLIDKPTDSRDDRRGDNRQRGRGASYGPSDGSGSRGSRGSGKGENNWEKWDGGDSRNGAGWRGNRGEDRWYQSMNDVKNKSFQVAAANAESSQQQAYIESLKLQLNKLNDEYTTQKAEVNKMKANIDKQVSSCQEAKSKLNDAMKSSVSDDMNKNSAVTLKEKIDSNTKSENIALLQQSVKTACDNATELNNSYNAAMKKLGDTDVKRQALIEKLVIATNKVTENKTTININLGGGMSDCGDRLGCGTGIEYNNMYMNDYFKPQRIDSMINNMNVPMPYQDVILF